MSLRFPKPTAVVVYIVAPLALVLGLVAGIMLQRDDNAGSIESGLPVYEGLGGDFTLTNQNGEPTRLSQFQGKAVLMFFGYTHCPDICPVTLSHLARIKQELGPLGERLQGVFVSVDPQRDTPQRLKAYVEHFDPSFIGLTGTEEQVAKVAKSYGVYYKLHRSDTDNEHYAVDHTAYGYLIDTHGQVRGTRPFEDWQPLVAEVRQLLGSADSAQQQQAAGGGAIAAERPPPLFDPAVRQPSREKRFYGRLVSLEQPVPLNRLHTWTLHRGQARAQHELPPDLSLTTHWFEACPLLRLML